MFMERQQSEREGEKNICLSTHRDQQLSSFLISVTPESSRSGQITIKSQIRLPKQLKLPQTSQFLKGSSERKTNLKNRTRTSQRSLGSFFRFSETTCSSLCVEELTFLDTWAVAFELFCMHAGYLTTTY